MDGPQFCGGLAQLGERLNGIQKVVGSIPIPSTIFSTLQTKRLQSFFMGWNGEKNAGPVLKAAGISISHTKTLPALTIPW